MLDLDLIIENVIKMRIKVELFYKAIKLALSITPQGDKYLALTYEPGTPQNVRGDRHVE